MYMDAQLTYSDAQALTGTSAVASTNIVDHGADRNLGIGTPLAVLVTIDVALAGSATETLTIVLQTDDNAAFSSATTVASTGALSEAQAAAGQKIAIPLPPDTSIERYTRLSYTMAGTTPTCTVTASLVPQTSIPQEVFYPDAIVIS
jgi:hypothetical protein